MICLVILLLFVVRLWMEFWMGGIGFGGMDMCFDSCDGIDGVKGCVLRSVFGGGGEVCVGGVNVGEGVGVFERDSGNVIIMGEKVRGVFEGVGRVVGVLD